MGLLPILGYPALGGASPTMTVQEVRGTVAWGCSGGRNLLRACMPFRVARKSMLLDTRGARANSSKTTSIYGNGFAPFPLRQILRVAGAPKWGIFGVTAGLANRARLRRVIVFVGARAPVGPAANSVWRYFPRGIASSPRCPDGRLRAPRRWLERHPLSTSSAFASNNCSTVEYPAAFGVHPFACSNRLSTVMSVQPTIRPGDPT
jgi:hypothetical protein